MVREDVTTRRPTFASRSGRAVRATGLSLIAGLLCAVLGACGTSAPRPAAAPPSPETFPSARTLQADAAFSADRFAEALAVYTEESAKIPPVETVRTALMAYRVGRAQTELRDFDAAARSLRLSLDLALRFPPPSPLEPVARQALGEMLRARGQPAAARQEFESVLRAREAAAEPREAAYALADVASTYVGEASFGQAFDHYARAEAMLEALGDAERGRVLLNAASVYAWLGRYDDALSRLRRATELCTEASDRRCIGNAWHGRAFALYLSGDFAGSRDAARAAVETLADTFPIDRARALNNLGVAELASGRDADGLQALLAALAVLDRYGDTRDRATVTDSIGTARAALKDVDGARRSYIQALALWRAAGHAEGERDTLGNLGLLLLSQGERDAAVFFLKLSVNAAQTVRGGSQALPTDLQRSLAKRLTPNYQILAGLLIDEGRFPEAQQVLRMLREHEFHEFLRGGPDDDPRTTRVDFHGAEAASRAHFEETMTLFEAADELERIDQRARAHAGELPAADRQRRALLQNRMLAAQSAFEAFLQEAKSLRPAEEARASTLLPLQSLESDLETLGHGAVIVQYLVLPDQLKIMLTTPVAQRGYTVRVARADLYTAANRLLADINEESVAVKASAGALYAILVPPELQADLDTIGARTLMVALDGALRYVPFAALHDSTQWLAEKYAVVAYNDASASRLNFEPIRPWTVRAFGMTQAAPGFRPLQAVRSEVEHIVGGGVGTALFDAAFTRDALQAAVDARPPVLHVASHFAFVPGTEDDSFLLLGDGGRLSLSAMKVFRFQNLELMTLSACQTAVGKGANRNGVEIEGLASLMLRQGAASVLATLWSVDDGSTAQFMADFYGQRRASSSLTKAEAFQAAQLRLARLQEKDLSPDDRPRRGTVEAEPRPAFDPQHPYAHPFYWAPFVLVGNWR